MTVAEQILRELNANNGGPLVETTLMNRVLVAAKCRVFEFMDALESLEQSGQIRAYRAVPSAERRWLIRGTGQAKPMPIV